MAPAGTLLWDAKTGLLVGLLPHVVCLVGVYHGSLWALRRWICASSLTPPLTGDIPPEAPIFEAGQTGLRSHFTWRNMRQQAPLFCGVLINPLMLFINARSKSQWLVDAISILFNWGLYSFITSYALHVVLATQSRMKLVPSTQRRGYAVVLEGDVGGKSSMYTVLASGLAGASLLAGWYGYHGPALLIVALWLPAFVLSTTGVPVALRVVVMAIGIAFVIGPTVGALFGLLSPSSTDNAPKGGGSTGLRPSPWLTDYSMNFALLVPYLFSGFFTAMMLRYDYRQSGLPSSAQTGPGECAIVPLASPRFPRPNFNTAMQALIASVVALKLIAVLKPELFGKIADSHPLLAPVPCILFVLLGAWRRGELKSLWTYYEQWAPNVSEEVAVHPKDIEETLDAKIKGGTNDRLDHIES